jgi:micrococcal nuclease
LLALVFVAAGSSVCSQATSPQDARRVQGQRVRVIRVVDGDTLIVSSPTFSADERLRLRGVDAPELAHDNQPAAYWGVEAKEYLRRRIEGRDVILHFDGTETRDRFGRLLAFVYVTENDCINLAMIRDGHAYADRRFASFMKSQLGQAEGEARKKGRGLWKSVTPEQMPAWRQKWLERRLQND